jgi:hypothetical protein
MTHPVEPYQAQASVVDASTCPYGNCQFTFPPVPAKKRLRLTSVSAQLGKTADTIVLNGPGELPYFVTKSNPASDFLTQVVSFFYEAGSTPFASVFVGSNIEPTTVVITLVGVLEPAS